MLSNKLNTIQLQQIDHWVAGKNYHIIDNVLCGNNVDGSTCVPDFSCCVEGIKTDIETKKEFRAAFLTENETKMYLMLMVFLQDVLPEVEIMGFDDIDLSENLEECTELKKVVL